MAVMLVAGLGGVGLAMSLRRDDKDAKKIGAIARTEDLHRRQEEALEALAALESQRPQMVPEDYEAERRALLEKGANAMRKLDDENTPPTPAAADDALSRGVIELTGALKRGEIDEITYAKAVAALSSATSAPAAAASASPGASASPTSPAQAPPAAQPPTDRKPPAVSPLWQGVAYTVAGGLVIGGLLWWAQSSAVPRRDGASMTGNQDLGTAPVQTLPPIVAQRIAEAEAKVNANPADIGALNELTSLHLRDPQKAYGYNQKALEADPANVDARMFDAIITAMMSMPDKAQTKLDAIIAENPNHGPSWAYKGLLLAETKQWDEAEVALLKAKELGIQDHTLDQALKIAQADGEMPPGMAMPGQQPPGPQAPSPAATGSIVVSGTINIDPGRANFKASDLYVSVKDPNKPGPPIAAKKLPPGPFPISFVVTDADRPAMGPMGGGPIPPNFMVTVRLDQDGNAMTKLPDEPQATVPAEMGAKLDLVLK